MSSPLLSSDKNYDEKFIDAGTYGAVFKITSKSDNSTYAMKQINLTNFDLSKRQEALENAKKEYNIYSKNIPNVLKSYGSYYDETEDVYRFSIDLMETDLYNFIIKNGVHKFLICMNFLVNNRPKCY